MCRLFALVKVRMGRSNTIVDVCGFERANFIHCTFHLNVFETKNIKTCEEALIHLHIVIIL